MASGQPGASIFYPEHKALALDSAGYLDSDPPCQGVDSMPDRVLDNGLQHQRRDQCLAGSGFDINLDRQPFLKPALHYLNIEVEHLELPLERDKLRTIV